MRYLLVLIVAAAIALPVQAANAAGNTASAGDSQGVAAPAPRKAKAQHEKKQAVAKLQEVDTIAKALTAPNKSPATIVGNIVEKVAGKKNHYIVDDGTGRMTVAIGPKALKGMNLTPDMKVSLKGRIRAAAGKAPVMGVRAVTIIK